MGAFFFLLQMQTAFWFGWSQWWRDLPAMTTELGNTNGYRPAGNGNRRYRR